MHIQFFPEYLCFHKYFSYVFNVSDLQIWNHHPLSFHSIYALIQVVDHCASRQAAHKSTLLCSTPSIQDLSHHVCYRGTLTQPLNKDPQMYRCYLTSLRSLNNQHVAPSLMVCVWIKIGFSFGV